MVLVSPGLGKEDEVGSLQICVRSVCVGEVPQHRPIASKIRLRRYGMKETRGITDGRAMPVGFLCPN
jgi:hypothetical protein